MTKEVATNMQLGILRSFDSSEVSSSNSSTYSHRKWQGLFCHYNTANKLRSSPNRKSWRNRFLKVLSILLSLGVLATLIWLILLLTIPRHHQPKAPPSGINSVVNNWLTPTDSWTLLVPWNPDFTRDITPLACHSHNDYFRSVPLFESLAAGCTSVEADIWLGDTSPTSDELQVGHTARSLQHDRTLQSLYIQPVITMLENQNANSMTQGAKPDGFAGVFQSSPNTTLTILLDFKSNGSKLWPYVIQELEVLRERKWLTHWNSSTNNITWAPVIIVASGDAPFDLLISNTTYRDIFYDAPLDDISNPKYNSSNSYYASVSMSHTLGKLWLWRFSSAQISKIRGQIAAASQKGLKARYWDAPSWPVSLREYIWGVLVEEGVGLLNVDVFSGTLFYPLVTTFGDNRLRW